MRRDCNFSHYTTRDRIEPVGCQHASSLAHAHAPIASVWKPGRSGNCQIKRKRARRVKTAKRRSAAEGSLDAPKRSWKILNRSDRAHPDPISTEQRSRDRARTLERERDRCCGEPMDPLVE